MITSTVTDYFDEERRPVRSWNKDVVFSVTRALKAYVLKIRIFWGVKLCSWRNGSDFLILEEEGIIFRNVGSHSPNDSASQPRKLESVTVLLSDSLASHWYLCARTFFRSPSLSYLPVHSRCRGVLFSLDHNQRHTTVCRTPLDEGSARRRDLYLTTQTLTRDKHPWPWWDSKSRSQQAFDRRPMP
jgi:hypothetical protein